MDTFAFSLLGLENFFAGKAELKHPPENIILFNQKSFNKFIIDQIEYFS